MNFLVLGSLSAVNMKNRSSASNLLQHGLEFYIQVYINQCGSPAKEAETVLVLTSPMKS